MFRPVARRLLASEVFDQLRDRILNGEMEPGAALPAERILATLLRVNRNAVREGLKRLQQAGLVAIQQGGATRVLDFRRTAGLEVLATMVIRADGTIDADLVRSIVELRTELAPIVGRFAAERAERERVDEMRAVVTRMREAKGDSLVLVRLALDFWAAVVESTGNIALQLAFNSLAISYGSVLEQMHRVMADEVRAIDDYEALVDAIDRGRGDKAGELARRIAARGEASVGRIARVVESVQRVVGRAKDEPATKKRRSS